MTHEEATEIARQLKDLWPEATVQIVTDSTGPSVTVDHPDLGFNHYTSAWAARQVLQVHGVTQDQRQLEPPPIPPSFRTTCRRPPTPHHPRKRLLSHPVPIPTPPGRQTDGQT